MKIITIVVIKANKDGSKNVVEISADKLGEILSDRELLDVEMKLNEIGYLRFHINTVEFTA